MEWSFWPTHFRNIQLYMRNMGQNQIGNPMFESELMPSADFVGIICLPVSLSAHSLICNRGYFLSPTLIILLLEFQNLVNNIKQGTWILLIFIVFWVFYKSHFGPLFWRTFFKESIYKNLLARNTLLHQS